MHYVMGGHFVSSLIDFIISHPSRVVASPIELSIENADVFTELGQSIAQFMQVVSIKMFQRFNR